MPAIGTGRGSRPAHVKQQRNRRRRAGVGNVAGPPTPRRVTTRPAPRTQPGPYRASERRKVARNRRTPAYQEALRRARVHGPASARGRRIGPAPMSDYEYRKAGELERKKAGRIEELRATRPHGARLLSQILSKVSGVQPGDTAEFALTGRSHPRILERELEGRGALAAVLREGGKRAAPLIATGQQASMGKLRVGKARTASNAAGLETLIRAAKDFANLPAQALPSVYEPVAGAVEAAETLPGVPGKGSTRRIKRVGKDISENDPLYNALAAGAETVKGNPKAAQKHLKRVKKAAIEHPGFTAAEFYGARGVAGRSLGTALRKGGRVEEAIGRKVGSRHLQRTGAKARRIASTERAPRRLEGTTYEQPRSYSPDVFRKYNQIHGFFGEKRARRQAHELRDKAHEQERLANHDEARRLHDEANQKDPDRIPEHEIHRGVDERMQVTEDVRRHRRSQIVDAARRINKAAHHEAGAISVVAQRIVRADRQDIADYIRELEAEFPKLGENGKASNLRLRRQLQKVIDNPKADMARLEGAAQAYEKLTTPIQHELVGHGMLVDEQTARARVMPYAVRNMKARFEDAHWIDRRTDRRVVDESEVRRLQRSDPTKARETYRLQPARLVDEHGNFLPTEAIIDDMRRNGVEPAAFVTQAADARGAKNFYVPSNEPPKISAKPRTGAATTKGTADFSPEMLVHGAARMRGLSDAAEGFTRTVREFARRNKKGDVDRWDNYTDAHNAAKDLNFLHGEPKPGAMEWTPVRLNPFSGKAEQLHALLEDVNDLDPAQIAAIADTLKEAVNATSKSDPTGPWALIPTAAAKRIGDHLDVGKSGIRELQQVSSAFRRTVLPLSTSWFTGNISEAAMRSLLNLAGPGSYRLGKRALQGLKDTDEQAYVEALSRMVGGGHYGLSGRTGMHVGAEAYAGRRFMGPLAQRLGRLRRTHGPKEAADAYNLYADWVFNSVNGKIESKFQTAMLGKAIKRSGLLDEHLIKTSKDAVSDAVEGLRDTNNQRAFGRQIDEMYGKYSKFSPLMRKGLLLYTPFGAWWLNSVRFLLHTLPTNHPATLTAIAGLENANAEWRKEHGMDFFAGKGALPGFLQGSVQSGAGRWRISRLTPFGLGADPLESSADQVLPFFSSALAAMRGEDWKGKKIRVKDADGTTREPNELELGAAATLALIDSTIPGVGLGRRIADKGPSALLPITPVKPQKKKTGGSGDPINQALDHALGGASGADIDAALDKVLH